MESIPQNSAKFNAQPRRVTLDTARTTPDLLKALIGSENTVCRTPQWITDEMPHYVAQTNRILWERWEVAAITLFNLRHDLTNISANHVWIDRLTSRFPRIDTLFPASYFEPEFEEDCFVEVFH